MKPLDSFVLAVVILFAGAVANAQVQKVKIVVDAGDVPRHQSPLSAKLALEFPDAATGTLTPADGGEAVPAQVDPGGTVRWIEPQLEPGKPKTYELAIEKPDAKTQAFHFAEGEGFRELLYGDKGVWRDMIKYDPANRADTFKPYKHVYNFDGQNFITKGPGGKYTHHRGIFFGFNKTQFGDFWHCPDVTQRHDKYLPERESVGPVAAHDIEVVNWVGKDDKPVVRDLREVTTWRMSPTELVMDFDLTVEALGDEPLQLNGDAHHSGFHFRADQEVAETNDNKGKAGSAVYILPASAKLIKDDVYEGCDWAEMTFSIKGKPYCVTHFDAPTNVRPIQYSCRPYGRVGSFFTATVPKEKPLKLRDRIIVRDGSQPPTRAQ